jgi:hypothetical protein
MRPLKYQSVADVLDAEIAEMSKPGLKKVCNAKEKFALADGQMQEMRDAKDWSKAKGKHLVAIYAWLHADTYKVDPIELLDGKTFMGACMAADKLIRDVFGGDAERAVQYVSWVWRRERAKLAKYSGNTFRIGWRLVFVNRTLVTDYRIDLVRGITR